MGFLWGSKAHHSAGFVRRLKFDPNDLSIDPFADPSLGCSFFWGDRLREAYNENLSPIAAITRWKGAPEDPVGGHIPANATELEAADLAELYERTNPGGPPPPDLLIQDGEFPDGTPVDRSRGWGPLISSLRPTYPTRTDAPIRFLPVTQGHVVLGYLWASTHDDAADYIARARAGEPGEIAAGWWRGRLTDTYEQRLSPTEALAACRRIPADHLGGVIGPDAPEQQLSSLARLIELAHNQ